MKKKIIISAELALLIEVLIFNLSFFLSLGNQKEVVTDTYSVAGAIYDPQAGYYTVTEPQVVLYAGGIVKDIKDIYFGIDFEDEIVSYSMRISDEGNAATAYETPIQYVLQWSDASKYIRIHPYGKVLTNKVIFNVTPGKNFTIREISYNPMRHLRIRPLRWIALFILLVVFSLFTSKSSLHEFAYDSGDYKTARRIGKALFIGIGIAVILFLNLRCGGYWNHYAYMSEYADLAESLAKGHYYLDYEVSDALLNAPNPYDFTYRDVNMVESSWDTAYFNGRYYCYFGITPVLLLYLPYYLLTGAPLNNAAATCVFSVIVWLGTVWLAHELIKRFFKTVPIWVWPVFSVLIGFCVQLVYLYQRPDMYDIPILAGNALALLGLASWLHSNRSQGTRFFMVFGSICIALVVGCRPQMEIIVLLAIPIFYNDLVKKTNSRLNNWKKYGAFILGPFILFALFVMHYNNARFGSPFDFGANYNLTTNDLTRRGFNVDRLGSGVFSYLFQLPSLLGIYPFMIRSNVATEYVGKVYAENVYGGVIATNLIVIFVALLGYMKGKIQEKETNVFIGICLGIGAVLSCLDATVGGILQRYMADFTVFFIIPGLIVFGVLVEEFWCQKRRLYYILAMMACCVVLGVLFMDFSLVCVQLREYTGDNTTLVLYHELRSYFVLQ